MKRPRLLLASMLLATVSLTSLSAVLDDVRDLIIAGDYDAALEMAAPVLKRSPRDAKTNYWYGRAALGAGHTGEALRTLGVAAERGYTDAYEPLVGLMLGQYDTEGASEAIDEWRAALKKARKAEPDALAEAETACIRMSNALARVENIPVIAEYTIGYDEMDRLLDVINSEKAPRGVVFGPDSVPFFVNNMSNEVFRTRLDSTEVSRLYAVGVLDDGSYETERDLTGYLGDGDIIAPFVMEDGETIYFASNRDDSLGGYDIYMTRRDGDGGFYEPTNMGMPYNSPDNDYLYAVDERAGIGWWITDRGADPDSVRVLVFVPNTTRVNIDADDENVVGRARMDDIDRTIPRDFDLERALARIPVPGSAKGSGKTNFEPLSLGNGRIITSVDQFRSPDAAAAMSDLRAACHKLADIQARLDSMRLQYGRGETALKAEIRSLEDETARLGREVINARNRVIRLENAAR